MPNTILTLSQFLSQMLNIEWMLTEYLLMKNADTFLQRFSRACHKYKLTPQSASTVAIQHMFHVFT